MANDHRTEDESNVHWRDKVCVACKRPLPTPTWSGQPYICCSGIDCGCGGGTLPVEFCSVECWENYEPEPNEPPAVSDLRPSEKRLHGYAARLAVNHARNTGRTSNSWQRFQALNTAAYEVRRALWGIDGPNAWCGRNERLKRYIAAVRQYDLPRLP